MKKIILLLFLLHFSINNFAQLTVRPNSYLFNKGSILFVKQNINLNTNSNLYLRNEGQLIQGTTGTSANTGEGKLSVFQEGTVNNYVYNYWCSPVGNASTTSGNESFGIAMLNTPTSTTSSVSATILPLSNHNGVAASGSLSIAQKWIWKYQTSNIYNLNAGGWQSVYNASTLAAGEGFTMKGVSGDDDTNVNEIAVNNPVGSGPGFDNQRYDFRGKPNDGTIAVNLAANNFTLTGNPYPSAMHVNAFLLDPTNTNCSGIAYYWEQDKTTTSHLVASYRGGYGTYSPVSLVSDGVYVPATFNTYNSDGSLNSLGPSSGLSIIRKYAPIGQGFIIKGDNAGTVSLKNTHRVFYKESNPLDQSQFERQNSETTQITVQQNQNVDVSHFRLNIVLNNQFTRQLALILSDEATDDFDRGVDAILPANNLPNDGYFYFKEDKYVIEGTSFNENKRFPLGVKSTNNCTFTFSLGDIVAFDQNQPIYIYDALDNSYHNLQIADFEVTIHNGTINDRFELTFKDANLLSTNPNSVENFVVFQNNTNQLLSVSNPKLISIKAINLYDISGKLILNKTNVGAIVTIEIPTNSLSEGVYLATVIDTDGTKSTQKIIVERTK